MHTGSASDAASALALLRTGQATGRPFDLALRALRMPDVDGLELALQIRSIAALATLPMVTLTSVGTHGRAQDVKDSGIAVALTSTR